MNNERNKKDIKFYEFLFIIQKLYFLFALCVIVILLLSSDVNRWYLGYSILIVIAYIFIYYFNIFIIKFFLRTIIINQTGIKILKRKSEEFIYWHEIKQLLIENQKKDIMDPFGWLTINLLQIKYYKLRIKTKNDCNYTIIIEKRKLKNSQWLTEILTN